MDVKLKQTLLLLLAAAAATVLLWAVLVPPKGEPLPPGAHTAPEGFALLPPAGWKLLAAPPAQGDFTPLARFAPEDGSSGSAGVAMSSRFPPEPAPVELLPFINAALPGALGTFQVDKVEAGELDHLPSLKAEGTGVQGSEELGFTVHVVRAADKTFAAGAAGPRESREAFLSSFRVLERPFALKHIFTTAKDEVRQEVFLSMLALVFALYKGVFGGLFK